ncbi:MAG TPA: transglutaminase domain-containing protein [Cyclobacteriaceae bacterium]|jgi:transglutaminase/protease-like cytokinesis protein 3|nr:transglutaminase domain-containing protein [Cyclobacteriaceae bacterium]
MKLFSRFFILALCSVRLFAQPSDFQVTDFSKADSIAEVYAGHRLNNLNDLAEKLTTRLARDEEKFRAIYVWVCNNIKNDYQFYWESKLMREKLMNNPSAIKQWEKEFSVRVFKKLLKEQKTVCTGYAYLVKELATRAGVTCVMIDGYGRTAKSNIGGLGVPNHAWNAVQLNGRWYLCDATWSSGAINTESGTFVKKYNNAYFLASPDLFIRNHYPLDSAWMLLRDKPTLNEFLNRPLVYSSIYRNKISPVFPKTLEVSATKGETISFQFKKNSDTVINKIEMEINGATASANAYQNASGLYCLDHSFASRGTYLVHVLFDADYAFTYSVKVR